ncbi:MAG: leucine--tRNA ligase, partial [Bacteroidales bacterium]|nr:leucine--tRNA ligase [Bacteroidales bacterium]
HPLGYIASDIFSRYKRLNGFNVLHPMGYDAYGLPAEQYAIQTGQHPAVTTEKNIARYREQLDRIGFSFDWNREVRTCEPGYYKWTQWAFSQMFNSFYCLKQQKALPIAKLVERFEQKGSLSDDGGPIKVACTKELTFTADEWNSWDEKQKQQTLMNYRIAYLGETMVNWCPELGTVLANDEVVNGVSERGGFPVEQRVMRQWCLRVSAYAQRLLDGLETIDWSDSIKETQRNWIGRSEGTEAQFKVVANDNPATQDGLEFTIFTTRADTMFGVTFMVLAPESKYVQQVVTSAKKAEVDAYLDACKRKTERDRQAAHEVTGVFTGAYAVNPITGDNIPIWVSEYVLAGYGTGAIMAVPAHDSRDWAFAKHFNLPIIPLIEGDYDLNEGSFDAKEGVMKNSANSEINLNGLCVKDSIAAMKKFVTEKGIGRVKVNYRLRDAIFSRQRYWGEPFPIYYKDGMPYTLPEECLPLQLPEVSEFKPTATGEPPLGHAEKWAWDEANRKVVDKSLIDQKTVFPLELCTMPGFAGSSAYYTRYTDPHNDEALVSREANDYWDNVDLYLGGSEHATGHLIYSRFWNKFLKDINVVKSEEPFKKLINQGMIQGSSRFAARVSGTNTFVSADLLDANGQYQGKPTDPIHVDVNFVANLDMDVEAFRKWRPEFADAEVITNADGKFLTTAAVEKMSKSKYNVVNPDDICEKYGADTLRIYEMFLGPIEQSKPWDTAGIDGAFRFLKKFWALFNDVANDSACAKVTDAEPSAENLKSLHKLIKKVTGDVEQFSYNTAISAFMVAVNELTQQKCASRKVLEQLVVLIAPFAPHIAEELWHQLGETGSVCDAHWPKYDEKYLVESTVKYPVQIGGKMRFTIDLPADANADAVKTAVLATDEAKHWIGDKEIVKFVFVPKKIVNVVTKG